MNKSGTQQQKRKNNSRPPSPSKGKSPIQINDEAESSKNKFDPLENLEAELINSKENTEESQPILDLDLASPQVELDP